MKIQARRWLLALLCAGVGFVGTACKQRRAGPNNPPIPFTAQELLAAYKDARAADAKYAGQILEVSGTADRTGVDSANHPFVAFKGDELGDIQCFVQDRYRDEVSKIKKGQPLTLRGNCLSRIIHITLDDCVIVTK